jgi:hypothetical protein
MPVISPPAAFSRVFNISCFKWLDEVPATHKHRRDALYLLVKVSSASDQLPPSLFVHGVDIGTVRDPVRTGEFADIYRGTYNNELVAIKRLRVLEASEAQMHPVLFFFLPKNLGLTSAYRNLQGGPHIETTQAPRFTTFFGVDADTFVTTQFLCMVSPWVEYGTVMDFVKTSLYWGRKDGNRLVS